jgi:hypothetical protein
VVWLAVAQNEALVAVTVHVPHVAPAGPREPEEDQVLVVRWRDGEDPLGPVADLVLAPQVDLGDDRADERSGERAITGGARPVDGGPQVGPQLAEADDTLDLVPAGQQLVDSGDLVEAPPGMALGDHVGEVAV